MTSLENQHWVPQFLIRQFVDKDGRIFRFNIANEKITKPPPKHAASEEGFNEFEIRGKTISFEHHLQKIETRAAPILKRISLTNSLANLTGVERVRVAEFIATQSFRTKSFYRGLAQASSKEDFGLIFEELWRSAIIVTRNIVNRYWALMVVNNDAVFYLGDNPVVLQHTVKPTSKESLGFDLEGVEAYLPISPKSALYMPCRSTGEEIITGHRNAKAMHKAIISSVLVGAFGRSSEFALAQKVIKNSGPLYLAFTEGRPFAVTPENIENLNYLQCSWAHDAVYSNTNDFSFAKMVFEKTPQYRGVPKTRLELLFPKPRP